MTEQSIVSQDMTLKRLFQDFYRVPDYQREYVWGEADAKGEGGDQVDQFLSDIHIEFEAATQHFAPEYFIGTIVVCKGDDQVFELIDGQQRTTTAYLTLCAIRDALADIGATLPEELGNQIAASTIDWQGLTTYRLRLDVQYEDAGGVLQGYAEGKALETPRDGSRSIRNLGGAYDTVREFLSTTFDEDQAQLLRFYGYLTNKVKVIRIETPTIAKALKIFETINDRGVGLDAMDLLKNLLFMHAKGQEFTELKSVWKALTDEIYAVNEKPLRFLRYYLLATFDLDSKLREDAIYDWFQKNPNLTGHTTEPLAFAKRLREAARAYANFSRGKNVLGQPEPGIENTRLLGGQSIKQHFMLLLAGRHLPAVQFSRLAAEVEKTMFVWLVTWVSAKEYERKIVDAAHKLRHIKPEGFDDFIAETFVEERADLASQFARTMKEMKSTWLRQFRLRYLLAKITQAVDLQAYGPSESRDRLADYTSGGNDIEHIMAAGADATAVAEFGEHAQDDAIIQSLGNLLLIEKSINRSISNTQYSEKIKSYAQSKFLLTRCQADAQAQLVGVADQITKTVQALECWPTWTAADVEARQLFLSRLACRVWDVPLVEEVVPA
ncbi:DUF262 domain-containing protein [Sphingomonas sp. S-NIH.Pt1_0416]|uniref:DUF262 domain-containing protein n=1 Tax=Sphingomonas sp. S-NIH.Pt1_0416 TaxID=1920123 RepID=UPI000F7F0A28|nr:DUF262 domain-containing protein [Sphingomonas sp. S-NIH.Pt1_0416]RSU64087.1 DUF262 domain-containing protein [Sphingomonas sp. S-NIH.Pt1_0416]